MAGTLRAAQTSTHVGRALCVVQQEVKVVEELASISRSIEGSRPSTGPPNGRRFRLAIRSQVPSSLSGAAASARCGAGGGAGLGAGGGGRCGLGEQETKPAANGLRRHATARGLHDCSWLSTPSASASRDSTLLAPGLEEDAERQMPRSNAPGSNRSHSSLGSACAAGDEAAVEGEEAPAADCKASKQGVGSTGTSGDTGEPTAHTGKQGAGGGGTGGFKAARSACASESNDSLDAGRTQPMETASSAK